MRSDTIPWKVGADDLPNSFEIPKAVRLTMNPFPEDCLTPTLKVKRYVGSKVAMQNDTDGNDPFRNVAAKKFQKEIDEMYEEGEANEDAAKL